MRLLMLLLTITPLLLLARENPFVSTQDQDSLKKVTPTSKPKVHSSRTSKEKSAKKEVLNYAHARFVFRENSVYIETKDRLIKHFAIKNPPSLVLDFKANSDFASKRSLIHTKPFTKLAMGAHKTHYRVVLRLDKSYHYKIEKRKYGEKITIIAP